MGKNLFFILDYIVVVVKSSTNLNLEFGSTPFALEFDWMEHHLGFDYLNFFTLPPN